ncbi:MAG: hypothetical protein ACR2OA_00460 [Rubripirellula sp.]|jgi:hypothetical protein
MEVPKKPTSIAEDDLAPHQQGGDSQIACSVAQINFLKTRKQNETTVVPHKLL